jgi:hypothetical protein
MNLEAAYMRKSYLLSKRNINEKMNYVNMNLWIIEKQMDLIVHPLRGLKAWHLIIKRLPSQMGGAF